jgi:FHS family L-fucose permease-like MFS transporter
MNTSVPESRSAATIPKTQFAFVLIVSLFFLWGFSNNLNPILIPHLQKAFTLTTTQSTLVDSAVYIAYFVIALPAGYVIRRLGYKVGIITGLILFSIGAFLFIPAANVQSYYFFLFALFVIACGLGFLETAANPYAAALGSRDTSAQRLNLAQSFNGLAAAVAPVVGARLILADGISEEQLIQMSSVAKEATLSDEAASVKLPYFFLGIILLVIAIIFMRVRLPKIQIDSAAEKKSKSLVHALKHKHLVWAVIAQFFFVGAQVCVFSLFLLYATVSAHITEVEAADYLGVCGVAFLIGRFFGTFLMKYVNPGKLLTMYALVNVLLSIVAIHGQGMITVFAVVLICFFMSIMFPTIFALGISDLGDDTEYGSSLLIMSIVGGAIMPRLFGMISDYSGNIQLGFFVPLICFAFVALFGWKYYSLRNMPQPNSN